MQIYFLTYNRTAEADQFYKQLSTLGADRGTVVLKKLLCLVPEESYPFRSGDLLILYVSTEDELQTLVAGREAFSHCRVILILPNGKADVIHQGLLLKPRFIDYKNGSQKILM